MPWLGLGVGLGFTLTLALTLTCSVRRASSGGHATPATEKAVTTIPMAEALALLGQMVLHRHRLAARLPKE